MRQGPGKLVRVSDLIYKRREKSNRDMVKPARSVKTSSVNSGDKYVDVRSEKSVQRLKTVPHMSHSIWSSVSWYRDRSRWICEDKYQPDPFKTRIDRQDYKLSNCPTRW
jgi:hypothetical protein